jgi:flagellar basal body rod protein FlgC
MKVKFIHSHLSKKSANLSTSMDNQCALGPDGQLLDESKIIWHRDPDDLTPIAPVTVPIHRFFARGSSPALIVNGSRRSARVPKPSKRVLDADNAEPSGGSKRPRASRVTVVESDPEDSEGIVEPEEITDTDGYDVATETDVDSEMVDVDAAEDAYAATKAMGDRDREVGFFILIYKKCI